MSSDSEKPPFQSEEQESSIDSNPKSLETGKLPIQAPSFPDGGREAWTVCFSHRFFGVPEFCFHRLLPVAGWRFLSPLDSSTLLEVRLLPSII